MSDYYRDGDRPHEGHHSGPPHHERRGSGENNDYYNHGDGDRERGQKKDRSDDHEVLGTLAGAVAGGLGGHALGGKSGHGVLGGLAGAVAGAFVGHEAEEKVDEWKDKRDEKKQHEQDDHRRDEERRGYEDGRRDERRYEDEHRRHSPPRGGSRSPPRHHGGGGDGHEVTVQQGDTLRGIAARFDGVSFEEIARLNNIQNPDMIYPGQVLRIPRRGY